MFNDSCWPALRLTESWLKEMSGYVGYAEYAGYVLYEVG
jgi:hypothetical protein